MLIKGKMVKGEKDGNIYTGKISGNNFPVEPFSPNSNMEPNNSNEFWVEVETCNGNPVKIEKMKFHISCLTEIDT